MAFKRDSRYLHLGIVVIGFVLVFMSGYYFNQVMIVEMGEVCADCVTRDCMDNDSVCGDFGEYWFKGLSLIVLAVVGGIKVIIWHS